MAMPIVSVRQLFEAGAHYGHHTRRRNPKMDPYIFGVRNSINILDLEQSVPMMQRALQAIRDVAASGGRVLFVGTKRQASDCIAQSAKKCGQYYVNHRWLGGMLTNWKTISNSIRRLKELELQLEGEALKGMTKKELLSLTRQRDKLERALGGIKEMGGVPNILFVIDTNIENISILEANKLGIPVVGIVDTNSDPRNLTFPVPGNDDAMRAIELYCELASAAVLDGLQTQMMAAGVDMGTAENVKSAPEDFGFSVDEAALDAEEAAPSESTETQAAE